MLATSECTDVNSERHNLLAVGARATLARPLRWSRSGPVRGSHLGRRRFEASLEGLPTDLLAAAREALRPLDPLSHELDLTRPPLASNRAVIYFLGRGTGPPLYVAKAPTPGAKTARTEYCALRQCHAWWRIEDRHRVAEPLALLPREDAFLTAYVAGPGLAQVLSRPLWRPGRAIEAAAAAGDFLRRLHRHAGAGADRDVELAEFVDEVLAVEAGELRPAGLALPEGVMRRLDAAPQRRVPARRARLHGDFAPRNLVLCGPGEVGMFDPGLTEEGVVEDDIATFLSMVSSASVFAAAAAWPVAGQLRLDLEAAFLGGYGVDGISPSVLGLKLIKKLMRRWVYRRGRTLKPAERPLVRWRNAMIDAQMRALITESALLLSRDLDGSQTLHKSNE